MHFQYGEAETGYLSRRDERMAAVIAQVGHIEREVDADLFSAVVHHIVGQQISTKAQATIWKRMRDELGTVDAAAVLGAGVEKMQSFGMTFRKAGYITDFARKIESGEFDLDGIWEKPDDEAIRELRGLKGVGVWTAEMILLFCMQRPNVFSYDDLAIQRGLRMVYHHRKIERKLFEKYRRRFSPYCSVSCSGHWPKSVLAPRTALDLRSLMRGVAMMYTMHYDSPLGGILLAADEEGLTGLWFETQKYFAAKLAPEHEEKMTPVLDAACRWLDVYFSGREPDFTPKLHLVGSDFRQAVWALLRKIPYGQTTTYGALAGQLAEQSGKRVSAQAVGGAVGHNPVSLIVPCHRVVGSGGSLTGYAGGVEKKMRLLTLENSEAAKFYR